MEAQIAAITAFLDIQFVPLCRFPPWTAFFIDMGQRLGVAFFISFLRHLNFSLVGQD
jgi:hypothetical protein